jgi:valyl-tRNA synthetase
MDKTNYEFKSIEEKWRKKWEEDKLFEFSFNENDKLFVVDTPPPYVSADHLHIGHIMSYAQAEFIVRYKRMQGYKVFYPMGFDDNGLPTERFVEKKYKIDKNKTTKKEFIDLCLKETKKGIETYRNLWNSLGISVDWSKTYSTISPLPTKVSQWSLIDLYKKDLLYRRELPILWCPNCQTAISQSDM